MPDLLRSSGRKVRECAEGPVNESFDETGILKRDGAVFELLRDNGEGRIRLILPRTPVDLVEKAVRVTGEVNEEGVVDADGVAPA